MLTGCLLALALALPLQRPVIGIYTQDGDYSGSKDETYIASSYVKWLEMAGAQVVPVHSYASEESLAALFQKVNGLLFPGGAMEFSLNNKWTKNAMYLLNLAEAESKRGEHFPVFGTCLGFELLGYLVSVKNGENSPLGNIANQAHVTRPLNILDTPSLYRDIDPSTLKKISAAPGLYHFNHQSAILAETFKGSAALQKYYKLQATSKNPEGVEFVSMMEGKEYPVFAVQYHPEKNNFEYKVDANRTREGILASQVLANNFVE